MNVLRTAISVFLVAVILLSIAGWIWAGQQSSFQATGARVVLGLGSLASLGALLELWRGGASHAHQ